MSSDEKHEARLERFLAEDCPECGVPGPQRRLSVIAGCQTCMRDNPYPVHTPKRAEPKGWRVRR